MSFPVWFLDLHWHQVAFWKEPWKAAYLLRTSITRNCHQFYCPSPLDWFQHRSRSPLCSSREHFRPMAWLGRWRQRFSVCHWTKLDSRWHWRCRLFGLWPWSRIIRRSLTLDFDYGRFGFDRCFSCCFVRCFSSGESQCCFSFCLVDSALC